MSAPYNTLLLDLSTNDLTVDIDGNIAMASPPYSLAQDAGSAIKLFQGELYFDTSQGVPYFATILAKLPSLSYFKAQMVAAALTVPGVVAAQCFVSGIVNRRLTGQVQVTDQNGVISAVPF